MITLATLHLATEQEIFNQVAVHLLKQGEKSGHPHNAMPKGFSCKYKDEYGNKCAAGCLISEEEYDPSLENKGWGTLVNLKLVPGDHKDLISDLQEIHDSSEASEWRDVLSNLALRHDFNTDCLKEFK